MEAALTTVIIGTGVLAIIEAQQAYLRKNDYAVRANVGLMLANEVRERMSGLPMSDPVSVPTDDIGTEETDPEDWDDLDDFANAPAGSNLPGGSILMASWPDADYDGPINASGLQIDDMERWAQSVEIQTLSSIALNEVDGSAVNTTTWNDAQAIRVTVTIYYRQDPAAVGSQQTVSTTNWIIPRRQGLE
jgi:hypothetical protein